MAREIQETEYRLIDKVTEGFRGIAKTLKGLSGSFTELNQAAELASKGIGLVTGAAAGIVDAVKVAGDYEEAMRLVEVRTKATAEEQVALQAAVEAAAKELGTAPQVAVEALRTLADETGNASDSANNLGTSLAFAKVNAQDAKTSIESLNDILGAFDEPIAKIGQLADGLTAVGRAANAPVEVLQKGLSGVAVAAEQANIPIEETLALIGALATRSIEGGKAAKSLTTIITEFSDPTSKASEALKQFGLDGQNFTATINALAKDSTAATEVLKNFGTQPAIALKALLADGGKAIQDLTLIIKDSGGATKEAAAALEGTFNDALRRATSQFEAAKISFLTPFLEPLANNLTSLGNQLVEFSQSPAFADLKKNFGEIANVDFAPALGAVTSFATGAAAVTIGLVKTFNEAAEAICAVIKAATLLKDLAFNERVVADFADIDQATLNLAEALRKAKEDTAAYAKESQRLFTELNKQPDKLYETAEATASVGASYKQVGPAVDAFGNSLLDIGKTAEKAKAGLFNMTAGLEAVGEEARKSEIRKLEEQYGRLLVAAENGGADNGALAKVRQRLQELAKAGESAGQGASSAKQEVDGAAESADIAGESFANYGAEAGFAAEESERLADSGTRVAKSLDGVADAASHAGKAYETNSALGEKLTAAFLNASNSFGNYQKFFFQNLKNIDAQAKIGNQTLEEALKLAKLRDPQLQREVEIRKQLLDAYQVGGPALDELVAIRVKEAEAADNDKLKQEAEQREAINRKVAESTKTIEEITAAREKERKEREAGLAVGQQELALNAANNQLGGSQNAASGANITFNLTFNFTGPLATKDDARAFVANVIVPELERLRRLSA